MSYPYYKGGSLDDLMLEVFKEILSNGKMITPTKGKAQEITGVLLELENPRARLSRTETRGRSFSCLGELLWYLAGRNDLEFISYYLSDYRHSADNGLIFGGYGPRLFSWKGLNQVETVTKLLSTKKDTRQAVIQLFDREDLVGKHSDVPCTCTLQFILRENKLNMFAFMRSNDAFLGLPHDVFSFTMIQEMIARAISADLGSYKHAVGSLHIYGEDEDAARQFMEEGYQSNVPMPEMPPGDPWKSVHALQEAEASIRERGQIDAKPDLHPYWADLVRLLQIFYYFKKVRNEGEIRVLMRKMSSRIYDPFIIRILNQLNGQ